jgi:hypothetical protein
MSKMAAGSPHFPNTFVGLFPPSLKELKERQCHILAIVPCGFKSGLAALKKGIENFSEYV